MSLQGGGPAPGRISELPDPEGSTLHSGLWGFTEDRRPHTVPPLHAWLSSEPHLQDTGGEAGPAACERRFSSPNAEPLCLERTS